MEDIKRPRSTLSTIYEVRNIMNRINDRLDVVEEIINKHEDFSKGGIQN